MTEEYKHNKIQKYNSKVSLDILQEIERSDLVRMAYSRMDDCHMDYVNLTFSFKESQIKELSPHTFGELVLKKDIGLFTRYYDADMPFSFLSKVKPRELKFHGVDEKGIVDCIKNWVENGVSYGDSTVGWYHPEPFSR
jgi:hypothetical protein